MTDAEPHAERAGREQARRVLLDLPPTLWDDTARWLRRAVGRVPRSELPSGLRPFADWKPDRWRTGRPRQALAAALADEPQLRDALAGELPHEVAGVAAERDAARLAGEVGEQPAAAALIASARWDELAALGAEVAAREASRERASAEVGADTSDRQGSAERDRLVSELSDERRRRRQLRDELDAARRRAEAAEADRDALRRRVAELEAQLGDVEGKRREEHRRRRDREQRLRRRGERAEARARLDAAELAGVAGELDALVARLRAAVGHADPDATADDAVPRQGDAAGDHPTTAAPAGAAADRDGALPRSVPAAEAGRPCRLPVGVAPGSPDAVRALLQVPQITVLVDGYNVTKHPRGRPSASLDAQRSWLVQLAGAVVARYRCRLVVVFDATDPGPGRAPAARGVRVVFSEGEEVADDLLLALLDGLDAAAPACVVTSDRELGAAVAARHADVVDSASFLEAVA